MAARAAPPAGTAGAAAPVSDGPAAAAATAFLHLSSDGTPAGKHISAVYYGHMVKMAVPVPWRLLATDDPAHHPPYVPVLAHD